jgi:hypothetical protein
MAPKEQEAAGRDPTEEDGADGRAPGGAPAAGLGNAKQLRRLLTGHESDDDAGGHWQLWLLWYAKTELRIHV